MPKIDYLIKKIDEEYEKIKEKEKKEKIKSMVNIFKELFFKEWIKHINKTDEWLEQIRKYLQYNTQTKEFTQPVDYYYNIDLDSDIDMYSPKQEEIYSFWKDFLLHLKKWDVTKIVYHYCNDIPDEDMECESVKIEWDEIKDFIKLLEQEPDFNF